MEASAEIATVGTCLNKQLSVDNRLNQTNKSKGNKAIAQKCAEPPNGGYGWVVVFASFMCNLTVDGICYTFGLFLPHFIEYYHSSEAITALIGSLLSGCYMLMGVFVSILVNKYGCRQITIMGSIMAAISFAVSTVAPNVYTLIITYGIITGSCFGFIYLPSIVSLGDFFTTKLGFATGIAVCGSGMGAFIFSPLVHWLLIQLDWKYTLLVLSGFILLCSIYGLLMKPPNKKILKNGPHTRSNSNFKNQSSLSVNSMHSGQRKRTWTITSHMTEMEAVEKRKKLKDVLDLSMLQIPTMALLVLSNIFGMLGYYIPYVYIARFATELEIDGNKAAWLLSTVGISNVLGRLIFGLLTDRFSGTYFFKIRISALFINNVCLFLSGLAMMAIPLCRSFHLLIVICVIFGFSISSYMSLTSIILVDLLTLELLSTTFGLISCVRGLFAIVGPPLAGLLYGSTNSYASVFMASGTCFCIASAISFIVQVYDKN